MCSKSESIGKISAALVAFSGEVKSIGKDANNPHFKSQYTSLDHMIDETKPLLHKHGLTVMQFPGGEGEKVTVRTMILHESGEWIESEPLTLKPTKLDPQGAGSAITYARRYSYAAALSLSLGDDDDANAASAPHMPAQATQQSRQTQYSGQQQSTSQTATGSQGGISEAQVRYIHKLKSDKNVPDQDFIRIVKEIGKGKESIKEFSKSEASEIINLLNNYVAQEYFAPDMEEDLPF
ncbi:ERF family protein [Cohnella zeiphila]|uniref:ERF family protein n=1 Tax=Cohnella zeiphila TaxID=2761120 RepID=A0A7X0VVF1_9BACL|nr:ERF family protein [Cohnella zeiphila]MBB6731916.1 ERF family protein [Cohnella zeiphila]